jgi:predicted AlkP superfamily pyrophosphatase or phosphodiesterase
MVTRYAERWGDGGFRRLLGDGTHYANAHYDHSTTFTAVGHATLFTGGGPAQHGIAGNDWFDTRSRRHVYSVEDAWHTILGARAAKPHEGASPRNLTSTTIGDEMIAATAGRAKVFGVSLKDRGAVIAGGLRGKSFWYDKDTGRFVTSTYYYGEYPEWVRAFNDARPADAWLGKTWALSRDPSSYLYAGADDRPFERPFKNMGRTFPHPLGESPTPEYYGTLRYTPMGDELTVQFAEALIEAEKLGTDDVTDLLAVSLSVTDYIGHGFGPDSLEAEENLLRLDQTLARLFKAVDENVGAGATLFVLSSDHGIDLIPEARVAASRALPPRVAAASAAPEAPESSAQTAAAGGKNAAAGDDETDCAAGRHNPGKLLAALNSALQTRFGAKRPLVTAFWNPSLYLDTSAVAEAGLTEEAVERALAEEVLRMPGFARAFTRTDLLAGRVALDPVARAVAEGFHPRRSGNVMLVQSPFWYLYDKAEEHAAMHGSPYSYDTYVPLLIAGPGVSRAKIYRRVSPRDVAPTLAAYLGVAPPSGSTGAVLPEVLGQGASPAPAMSDRRVATP